MRRDQRQQRSDCDRATVQSRNEQLERDRQPEYGVDDHTANLLPNGHVLVAGGDSSSARELASAELYETSEPATRPQNISMRLPIATGENVLIGGFIIAGSTPKKVIVRALGPSLTAKGVAGALADPVLELHRTGRQRDVERRLERESGRRGSEHDPAGAR